MHNQRYKFCVVGGGTMSAVISMLLIEGCIEEQLKMDITYIYDSSIPIINMSESTSAQIAYIMKKRIGFLIQDDLPEISGTIKFANKYINFGDGDFYVNNSNTDLSLHIDSSKFVDFVLKKIKEIYSDGVTIIYDNVKCIKGGLDGAIVETEYEEVKYDYVFDCRGLPSNDELKTDDYDCSFESPINSVLSYSEEKHYNEMYTECTATKDGLMIGIPLINRKIFDYVYNNKITSIEDATKNFKELKNIPDDIELCSLSRNSFFKKKVINGNIITLGDGLFFIGPLSIYDSSNIHHNLNIAILFLRNLFYEGKQNSILTNGELLASSFYTDDVLKIIMLESLLLYQTSVNIDSEFWKYARDLSSKGIDKFPKELIKKLYEDTMLGDFFGREIFDEYLNGLKIDINNYM